MDEWHSEKQGKYSKVKINVLQLVEVGLFQSSVLTLETMAGEEVIRSTLRTSHRFSSLGLKKDFLTLENSFKKVNK